MKFRWRDKTQWRLKFAWWPVRIVNEQVTVWLEPYYYRTNVGESDYNLSLRHQIHHQTQEKRATELFLGAAPSHGCTVGKPRAQHHAQPHDRQIRGGRVDTHQWREPFARGETG